MPNVKGMKFPYTPAGKEAAKKASAKMTAVTSMRKDKKQSKGFSGANSQMGPSY
jgi:hypothetical protein